MAGVSNLTAAQLARAYSGGKGVTYSGFVLGETPAVLGGSLTFSFPAGTGPRFYRTVSP